MAKEPRKELSADYLGYHVENLIPKKVRKKKFIHPIFIYSLDDLDPENYIENCIRSLMCMSTVWKILSLMQEA